MSTYTQFEDTFDRSAFIVIGCVQDNGKRDFVSDLINEIALFHHVTDRFYSKLKGENNSE